MAMARDDGPRRDGDGVADRLADSTAVPVPPAERVLLLVDVIHPMRFEGADALAPRAAQAAPRIAALRQRLSSEGVPAIYVNDNFGHWRSDFAHLVARCRRDAGVPSLLARLLAPQRGDITLLKARHSAFLGTPLHDLLMQMETRELIIVGFATDLCVLMTAADAHQRGFRLWIPADTSAAENAQRHVTALRWMQRSLRARVQCNDAAAPGLPSRRQSQPGNRTAK
jgi:nicotinamidase-related amidase